MSGISIGKERNKCIKLDCLTRPKQENLAPPPYSSLFIDVDAPLIPMPKNIERPRESLFKIPLAESPALEPQFHNKRTSVLRRSPSIYPNLSTHLEKAFISHVHDRDIPIPPNPNPFNLPTLPARDYIINKIQRDEKRVQTLLLDKLEQELTSVFYENAKQDSSPRSLYSHLFHDVMDVIAKNFQEIREK